MQAVDVPVLVQDLVTLIEPSLRPAVRLDAQFDPGALVVVTDPNQLDTAILNLCLNARDAMPEGGLITIRAARHSLSDANVQGLERGDYVCLAVTDEGEGMDDETLAKAAEPFFTTKGVGKGSGLGLPMVHGLAAQSGGKLVLKSVRGRGTTAELWLPSADDALTGVSSITPARPEATSRPLNILAVDDDALVLMNTSMMLEDLGHSVVEASNGRQALSALETAGPFDMVISDHAMPGMTGSQLAASIHERWPGLPVLLATGYAELPGGSTLDLPLLSKPFSQRELADAVASALRR
jgi:CheY-like chemotaxis protein